MERRVLVRERAGRSCFSVERTSLVRRPKVCGCDGGFSKRSKSLSKRKDRRVLGLVSGAEKPRFWPGFPRRRTYTPQAVFVRKSGEATEERFFARHFLKWMGLRLHLIAILARVFLRAGDSRRTPSP